MKLNLGMKAISLCVIQNTATDRGEKIASKMLQTERYTKEEFDSKVDNFSSKSSKDNGMGRNWLGTKGTRSDRSGLKKG